MEYTKHIDHLFYVSRGNTFHLVYVDYAGNFLVSYDYPVDKKIEFINKFNDVKKYNPVFTTIICDGRYFVFMKL